jgi:hypothetical protein
MSLSGSPKNPPMDHHKDEAGRYAR